jgi:polysaccharide export outer membrane protein
MIKIKKNQMNIKHCLRLMSLLLVLTLSSCYTSSSVNYLQSKQSRLVVPVNHLEYTVQPNDILNIVVQSRDPEQSNFFNITTLQSQNIQADPASLFLTGYTVNNSGRINLAIVGELKVSDLTVEEIRVLVQEEIDKFLLNATVTVKLTSFKISVLGDVKNPGTNYIYNSQANIFEALSAAGDLNITAKRKDVKLIRQLGDTSIVVNLDLTDPMIIKSPYYFLHPNDVIYIEPSKRLNASNNLPIITVLLSAVTTGVLVLTYVKNN